MKKNRMTILLVGVLVALGTASCAAPATTLDASDAAPNAAPAGQPTSDGSSGSAAVDGGSSATSTTGSFTDYTPEAVSAATADEDVILFFHASWCATCKLLASDIEVNVAAIPAGVKILKVDYDSQTELKQKYGVTFQHTLVQVQPDGTQIAKWSLSRDLDALVKEIR